MTVVPMRPDAPKTNNPFRHFHELGWTRLLPLYPADAEIAGAEKLSDDVLNQRLGKAPAQRLRNGQWVNFSGWALHKATEQDLDQWHAWGANVGFCLEKNWLVFDIDVTEARWADEAERVITDHLGQAPCRIGRAPKRMLFYRTSEPINPGAPVYVTTEGGEEKIELFGQGRNVALFGTHRKAGKKMEWPRRPIASDALPVVTPDAFAACVDALVSALPEGARSKSSTTTADRATIDQDSLKARNIETLKSAVDAIRNTRKDFGGYDDWVRFAAAIRAAVGPEGFYEGEAIFTDFSERTDIPNETESPGRVYRSVNPPFAVGAKYVYEIASRHGWNDPAAIGAEYFDPVPEREPSPFDTQAAIEREQTAADTYPLLSIGDLANRPPPTFLIDRYVPDVSVGFLYSAPGVGKSFLALDMALSIAHGCGDWQGEKVTTTPEKRAVVYIASEGSFDLGNRVKAWHAAREKRPDAPLYVIEATIDFMQPEDIDKLLRSVKSANVSPAMVIVDTVSRAMPGADENAQKDMTLFVRACDQVRETFRCAVLGVHHASKSGDLRGSTVLRGAGDFVIRLEKRTGTIRELEMEKQKAAPDGWTAQFSFGVWQLDDGQSSLVVERVDGAVMPGGGVNPASAVAVLEAMERAWAAGEPWAKSHQSRERFAVRRICMDFGYGREEAEGMLSGWVAMGLVVEAVRDAKTHVKGYQVAEGAISVLKAAKAENGMSELLSEEADVFG